MIYVIENIRKNFSSVSFDEFMQLRGESFRRQQGRATERIILGEKTYFIKRHEGVGWKEILKNLFTARLPVISAKNEWQSIEKLRTLGVHVPQVIAYGKRGLNPARLQSFILLEEIAPAISLEKLTEGWQKNPPPFILKRNLIEAVARVARILHTNGMNHRDFYICHFLLDISSGLSCIDPHHLKLFLIDLHRAQIRRLTPSRWIIKDLSSLYFSTLDIGLTLRDCYRFMRIYEAKPLRAFLNMNGTFWQKVKKRGQQLYWNHKQG